MNIKLYQAVILLTAFIAIIFVLLSFTTEKRTETSGSDIEIQYCGSQKFYVLKNSGQNVAFIKAN